MPATIRVLRVTKRFRHVGPDRPRLLKDAALRGPRRRSAMHTALDDVSLEIQPGTAVGLVGRNGAGKSTLLRLMAGVGRPDLGRIEVTGRVGAIFELGTGFHPDLTGRESATIAGVIAGLRRSEVQRRLPAIVEFAQLEDFVDAPLRTYSSGMQARLAFAVATHVDADVMLVDEALAVGDVAFQIRCIERLQELRRNGATVVVVSHQHTLLEDLCDDMVWLEKGRVVAHGEARDISERYVAAAIAAVRTATPHPHDTRPRRLGTHQATIGAVRLLDRRGDASTEISVGEGVTLAMNVSVPADLGPARLGVRLVSRDGTICLDTSTEVDHRISTARLEIERLDLAPAVYGIDVGLYSSDWRTTFDFHWHATSLTVAGAGGTTALLAAPARWVVQ